MKQMFSDYQLKSFENYIKTCPKPLLGVWPLTPQGAYEAVGGAKAHGFHRRGVPFRAFSRGGAFAFDDAENEGEDPNMSKYGASLVALEKYLRQILSTEQMQEISPLIESVCHQCKVAAMNGEDDGEEDVEAMDRPRRARDDPPDFRGSPRTGGDPDYSTMVRGNPQSSLPNRSNRGSAMDGRPGRVTQAAADSFNKMFNPSPLRRV
jgi:hypothetical protein